MTSDAVPLVANDLVFLAIFPCDSERTENPARNLHLARTLQKKPSYAQASREISGDAIV